MKQLRFDIADLQAMVAVVERGGFRAAASAINLSQPALSRRIDKLEEQGHPSLIQAANGALRFPIGADLLRT